MSASDPRSRPSVELLRSRWQRVLLLGFAWLCIALAIIGVIVPGMPTTVFVLMAAWAALRSSPRLHDWLEQHRLFGPMIANWRAGGFVSRRAKWAATLTMIGCAVITYLTASRPWVAPLSGAIMATVAVWLWLRPEPPPR